MTESRFTPGPWRLSPEEERAEWVADAGAAHAIDAKDPVDGRLFEVAAVWGIDRSDRQDDRSLANALLIAAAPELLAALRGAVALADENKAQAEDEGRWVIRPPRMQAMYDKCVAAIAKATGEQA